MLARLVFLFFSLSRPGLFYLTLAFFKSTPFFILSFLGFYSVCFFATGICHLTFFFFLSRPGLFYLTLAFFQVYALFLFYPFSVFTRYAFSPQEFAISNHSSSRESSRYPGSQFKQI